MNHKIITILFSLLLTAGLTNLDYPPSKSSQTLYTQAGIGDFFKNLFKDFDFSNLFGGESGDDHNSDNNSNRESGDNSENKTISDYISDIFNPDKIIKHLVSFFTGNNEPDNSSNSNSSTSSSTNSSGTSTNNNNSNNTPTNNSPPAIDRTPEQFNEVAAQWCEEYVSECKVLKEFQKIVINYNPSSNDGVTYSEICEYPLDFAIEQGIGSHTTSSVWYKGLVDPEREISMDAIVVAQRVNKNDFLNFRNFYYKKLSQNLSKLITKPGHKVFNAKDNRVSNSRGRIVYANMNAISVRLVSVGSSDYIALCTN